jgi:hypothetical protein
LLGTLALLALVSLLALLLPQSPVPPANEAAFLRWLAEVRPSLGGWTRSLADLGLLSLRTSWFRLPLALLVLIVAVRVARLREREDEAALRERLPRVGVVVGALFLLLGWFLQLQWGWMETGVVLWRDESLTLSERALTLAPRAGRMAVQRHGYGLYTLRERDALGLEIEARNEAGEDLTLQTSLRSEPQERLRLVLTQQRPDGYFTISDFGLVFRATLQRRPPDPVVQVQVYQSSSGTLLTETLVRGSGSLYTEGLHLSLESTPLPQLRVVYNPGLPFTVAGWLLLGAAGVMTLLERRPTGESAAEDKEQEVEEV